MVLNLVVNLIEEYVNTVSSLTDAPHLFHESVARYLVSTLIGKSVTVPVSYLMTGLRPNLWFLLVGPSGLVRKTTSLRFAKIIIQRVRGGMMLPDDYTPEALIANISERGDNSSVTWVREEFGSFFRKINTRDYMEGVKGLLSSLYSGMGETRELRRKKYRIPDGVYITVLGAMPTPVSDYFTDNDFKTGLLNRFILVYAKRKEKWVSPLNLVDDSETKLQGLVEVFEEKTREYEGVAPVVATFSPETRRVVEEFSRGVETEMERAIEDGTYTLWHNYLTRATDHLIKLSVVEAVAEAKASELVRVEEPHVRRAMDYYTRVLGLARELVDEVEYKPRSTDVPTIAKPMSLVYETIKQNGVVTIKDLYQKTRMSKNQLKTVVVTLVDAGMVKAFVGGDKRIRLTTGEPDGSELTARQLELFW